MTERIIFRVQPAAVSSVAGGPPTAVAVSLENIGDVVDAFDLRVVGIPADWFTLSQSSIPLYPGELETVTLSLHPPRREDVRAADYAITVTASSRVEKAEVGNITVNLALTPSGSFDVQLAALPPAGRRGKFQLLVRSLSDGPLTVSIGASDRDAALRFAMPASLNVEPYGHAFAPITVRETKSKLVGEPVAHGFTVGAAPALDDLEEAARQTKSVQGTFTSKPFLKEWPWAPLPGWAKFALLTLLPLALLAWALLTLDAAGTIGPDSNNSAIDPDTGRVIAPPIIHALMVDRNDGRYVLKWDVDGAQELQLNGRPIEGGGVTLPEGANGRYELVAINSKGQATATASLAVFNGPLITKFSADPASVQEGQGVTLSWAVAHATRAWLYSPDGSKEEVFTSSEPARRGDTVSKTPGSGASPYLFVAENEYGYASAAIVVTVTPLSQPDQVITPPPLVPAPRIDELKLVSPNGRQGFFTLGRELDIVYRTSSSIGATLAWGDPVQGQTQEVAPSGSTRVRPPFREGTGRRLLLDYNGRFPVFIVASNSRGERAVDMKSAEGVREMEISRLSFEHKNQYSDGNWYCGITVSYVVVGDSGGSATLSRQGAQGGVPAVISESGKSYEEPKRFPFNEDFSVTYSINATNRAGDVWSRTETYQTKCFLD